MIKTIQNIIDKGLKVTIYGNTFDFVKYKEDKKTVIINCAKCILLNNPSDLKHTSDVLYISKDEKEKNLKYLLITMNIMSVV